MWLIVLLSFMGASAQSVSQLGDKCSQQYACPPQYLKIGKHCYFFSKNKTMWQDAFFTCQDLNGKFLIIRNSNQDKLLRSFLDKISIVDEERWIGGMYDWEQMLWKWGSSGLPIRYKGFSYMAPEDKEKLKWHCVVMDPSLDYKWNSRSCLEEKHFICQTKLKRVHGRKKVPPSNNPNKYHQLNEVLDPLNGYGNSSNFKEHIPNGVNLVDYNTIKNNNFAFRNDTVTLTIRDRKVKSKKNKSKKHSYIVQNGTEYYAPELKYGDTQRRRRNKSKEEVDTSIENIHTKTYYGSVPESPLHPRVLTEEVSFP